MKTILAEYENINDALLQLPDLVLEVILSFLDVESLLNLRLTCTTTKNWIDSSHSIISRLQLTLRSEQDLISLLSLPQKWTNFCFLWDDMFSLPPKGLSSFISFYSNSITILDFSKATPDDTKARNAAIVELLLACPRIISLKICELSCLNLSRKKDGLLTLIRNWSCLKSLSIVHMLCPDYHGIDYFSRLLEGCGSSLEELDPPTIALSSPEYLSFNYKLYFKTHIVTPILQLLEQKHCRLNKLHVQEHLFDGDPGLLFHLAQSCLRLKKANNNKPTILHPETFLPFSRSMFMEVPSSQRDLFQCLGRLGGINDLLLSMGRDQNASFPALTFLSVSFRSFFISDEMLESCVASTSPLLSLPALREVEIEMTNDPPWEGRPYKLSSFMAALCSSPHPSVRKLILAEVSRANDTTLIRASDVVAGFPCLTRIDISNWDAGNSEFALIWLGIPSLVEVQLRFCHHLGDDGLKDMVKLEKLRVLTINDVGPLTDSSYVNVFRHLQLRSFYHYSSNGCLVTRKGYNSLATGEFRTSIRHLLLQNSHSFPTLDQFCEFLAQFPNLRPQFDGVSTRSSCTGASVIIYPTRLHQQQSCCVIY